MNRSLVTVFILSCLCSLLFAKIHHSKLTNVDVLVLGAGVSGIAVAESLHQSGINNFLVLEGQDYIGGRIKHVKFAGHLAPLGAGWIHGIGKDNPMWVLSQKLKMQVHYDNYSDIILRNVHNGHVTPNIESLKKSFMASLDKSDKFIEKRLKKNYPDLPLHSTLAMHGWEAKTPESKAAEYFFTDFENGISPRTSSAYIYGVTGLGQDVVVTDSRGYAHILENMAEPFKDKVLLNTPVTSIHSAGQHIFVRTRHGKYFKAKHVVVSFSSGVLAGGGVKFKPELPTWKSQALHLVPMCHYCKVFMRFPRQFWEDKNYIMLANDVRGKFVHWQNFEKPTLFAGKNVFLVTVTEDRCQELQLKSDHEVVAEIMHVLRQAYGRHVPPPLEILRNDWTKNPFFLGSYSNPVVGMTEDDWKALQEPVNKNLWFTGEYTAGSEEYGFTHGAYTAGKNEAKRLIKCIKTKKCPNYNGKLPPKCVKSVM